MKSERLKPFEGRNVLYYNKFTNRGECMKRIMRQFIIGLVALFTFGMISPNHEIWTALEEEGGRDNHEQSNHQAAIEYSVNWEAETSETEPSDPLDHILEVAKDVAYVKFGTKIGPVIADRFEQDIFPVIESKITEVVGSDSERSFAVTTTPSGNYAEKIFNVFDETSGDALLEFHVRTDKKPKDGYFYNFHYHSAEDDFREHHDIGEVFWSKNTPPKWLS